MFGVDFRLRGRWGGIYFGRMVVAAVEADRDLLVMTCRSFDRQGTLARSGTTRAGYR